MELLLDAEFRKSGMILSQQEVYRKVLRQLKDAQTVLQRLKLTVPDVSFGSAT